MRLKPAFPDASGGLTLAALVMAVFTVQFLAMPRVTVKGDPVAIRVAAAHLLHQRQIGIPGQEKDRLGPLAETRGQYFYENEQAGRLFSKYGALNTILFIPPLVADWVVTGQTDPMRPFGSLILFQNLYNLVFAMLIAWLLFRIAGLYTDRRILQCLFVLCSMFTTFLWHYLRAQSGEIFQVLFFLVVHDQFVRTRRALEAGPQERDTAARHLRICMLFAAALALLKSYYLLLFPVLIAFCWPPRTAARESGSDSRRLDLQGRIAWLGVHAGIIGGLAVALMMAINAYKFGSPFHTGYGQFQNTWYASPQMDAFSGFLIRPDRSVFLHYPLLILALVRAVPFFRRHRVEYGFVCCVAGLYFLLFCCFENWAGHWSYGPRFLLFVLPLLSLPAISALEDLWRSGWTTRRTLGRVSAVLILGASLWAQLQVNRYSAFVYYDLKSFFSNANDKNVNTFFGNQHFALLAHHLHRYSRGAAPFPPLEMLAEWQTLAQQEELEAYFETFLWTNYFWFGKGDLLL